MNVLEKIGGLIAVVCTVGGLLLQVRIWVAGQRAAEAKARDRARRKTLRQGYEKRTAELSPVIDRVLGVLDGAISASGNPAEVERRLNKAMTELTTAREGEPDDTDDD